MLFGGLPKGELIWIYKRLGVGVTLLGPLSSHRKLTSSTTYTSFALEICMLDLSSEPVERIPYVQVRPPGYEEVLAPLKAGGENCSNHLRNFWPLFWLATGVYLVVPSSGWLAFVLGELG